jgi:hypothetical protein
MWLISGQIPTNLNGISQRVCRRKKPAANQFAESPLKMLVSSISGPQKEVDFKKKWASKSVQYRQEIRMVVRVVPAREALPAILLLDYRYLTTNSHPLLRRLVNERGQPGDHL